MKKWLNKMPLKQKLLGITAAGLAVMAVMTFVIIQILSSGYNKMLYQTISESLSYSEKGITDYMEKMENLTEIFLSDQRVQNTLTVLKKSAEEGKNMPVQLKNAGIYVGEYYQNYSDGILKYISLNTPASVLKTNLIAADKVPGAVWKEIWEGADQKSGAPSWSVGYMNEYGLFLARNIRQIEGLKLNKLGTIVLNIDMNALVKSCTNFEKQYGETEYLILQDDALLYHTGKLSLEDTETAAVKSIEQYGLENINGTQYFISHGSIEEYGWDYYCLVSYEKIARQLKQIRKICLWITLLDAVVIMWLTASMISRLVFHISSLKDRMQQFAADNTRVPKSSCDYTERKDELGALNRQFDEMSRKIIELIQENYVNELLKKEAQIKALENQINPHFLYNTLDSIKWRAKAIGDSDISDMVEALGILLRTSLRKKDEKDYNVGREMEIVESYILIQKFRYEERLVFENEIDKSWYDFLMPKMVLQPLIENAIFYGLELNVDECRIILTGEEKGGCLHFYVKNTESEFEENVLEKLENEEIRPHGNGVGLLNIDKRMKIQFGSEYGLRLYNEEEYAVAELVMPKARVQGEEQ